MRKIPWAFLLALALPLSLSAQSYAERTRGYLNSYVSNNFGGWSNATDIAEGSLRESETTDWDVDLNRGQEYVAVAACDQDCDDIDLYIIDPSGNEVASDVSVDDFPTVRFTASRGGIFKVRVRMYSCNVEPCFYALRFVTQGARNSMGNSGGNRGGGGGSSYAERTMGYLNAYVSQNFSGWENATRTAEGSLDEGETEDWDVQLNRGTEYIAVAACDQDCDDIDLYVIDPSGSEVASDVSVDDFPTVRFTARRGGTYQVRVRMYSCSVEPCYYAMRFLQ
jgi:hypothetical protein